MRCIHIFPRFEKNYLIEGIREEYDTLYECIEPHITLVFPFESDLPTEEISEDIRRILRNEKPFEITASRIEAVENDGFYMFLNIKEGEEKLCELHYKMYDGILRDYQEPWTLDGSFLPHIIVGRFEDKESMLEAFEEHKNDITTYRVLIDKVYIERIGEDEESVIEEVIELNGK